MNQDTIFAPATPPGKSAIAVIRISGNDAFIVMTRIFRPLRKKTDLLKSASHQVHLGSLYHGEVLIDKVLVSLFKAPHSYTGENIAEISVHGSMFIVQKVLELLSSEGLRMARPGEFTLRAFLNGKFDLSQAEAVADLIASNSDASHALALTQMRGGFSSRLKELRQKLVDFASLIELELDFSEEDVEFANRKQLNELLETIKSEVNKLASSFARGNVLKHGIPVAIIGKPNVGKSTLLNAILNEEKALVSEVAGTTRDAVEDVMVIGGIAFRFIDTAGLRSTRDFVENLGIDKTYEKMNQAQVILYVVDISTTSAEEIKQELQDFAEHIEHGKKRFIIIANKTDLLFETPHNFAELVEMETIFISARRNENIQLITESLLKSADVEKYDDNATVSNARHYEALTAIITSIENIEHGFLAGLPSDLISTDLHLALHHLGTITGEVSTEELLDNVFSKFCIGK